MIWGQHAPEGGMVFFSPLNRRQRMSRRRWAGAGALVALAFAGAVFGGLQSRDVGGALHEPLSYLPQ